MNPLHFPLRVSLEDAEGRVVEVRRKTAAALAALERYKGDRQRRALARELLALEGERLAAERMVDFLRAS